MPKKQEEQVYWLNLWSTTNLINPFVRFSDVFNQEVESERWKTCIGNKSALGTNGFKPILAVIDKIIFDCNVLNVPLISEWKWFLLQKKQVECNVSKHHFFYIQKVRHF